MVRRGLRSVALGIALLVGTSHVAAQPDAEPVVVPPAVRTHVDAVYPTSALSGGQHADVTLLVTVDAHGRVTKVEVAQSGGPVLDEAAIVAVRQWTFAPATKGGNPIAARVRIPFHFAPPAPPAPDVAPAPGHAPQGTTVPPPGATQGVSAPSPISIDSHPPGPTIQQPEEVRIHGHAPPPSRGIGDFNMRIGALGAVPRANASEMLKLAPSILLTNDGGDGHAEQIFLRGFDAREGQDIELTVGGVPINEAGNLHGNGYADTHFIIPEVVTSLRVIEGPFDPHQGNFAVAGSADYELGLTKRGLTAKYTRGSFNTERILLTWGPKEESLHTFGAVELHRTDGYGQNRDSSRGSAIGQYEAQFGKRGSYRITTTAYSSTFHSAGVLRNDDYESGRFKFFDAYNPSAPLGGQTSRYSIAGDIETKAGDTLLKQQLFIISRGMRLTENFTGYLLDVQTPIQPLHGQRGDRLDLAVNETTIGARGSARWKTEAFGLPQELELGYFARGDAVTGTQYRIEEATQHPYRLNTDIEAKVGDLGLFADTSLRPLRWITVRGGARADLFSYDVLDKCAAQSVAHPSKTNPPGDTSCLSQQDFGKYREPVQRSTTASAAFMPRATVLFGPFKKITMSMSYGQGVRSIDPIYVSQDTKTPFARVDSYEAGVAYFGGTRDVELSVRSMVFQTKVERDLIFSETAGRNVLGGGTTRTGWIGAMRATGTFFDQSASLTTVRSTFDDTHLLVPYVPDLVMRSDTALFHDMPFKLAGQRVRGVLGAGITYVGHRALPYGQRSDTIFTVDSSASLGWDVFELGVAATNLLGRRYRLGEYNYASDFHTESQATLVPSRHFSAGAPRAFFVSLSATLGGP